MTVRLQNYETDVTPTASDQMDDISMLSMRLCTSSADTSHTI